MALARARQAARRTKDRWKAKQWFQITAPASFSNKVIAETLADEPEKVMGRTAEASMFDLTGDMKQMHIKLHFQVTDVQDRNAKASYVGHEMTSDYVRRLTRRGATKISAVFDLRTKDGSRIRVKPFAITDRRAQTTQAQAIRAVMQDELSKSAQDHSLSGFLADLLVGDLTSRIYKEARKIHPVRRIEVAKAEVLKAPTVEIDETPIITEQPETDDSEEEGDAEAVELAADSEEE